MVIVQLRRVLFGLALVFSIFPSGSRWYPALFLLLIAASGVVLAQRYKPIFPAGVLSVAVLAALQGSIQIGLVGVIIAIWSLSSLQSGWRLGAVIGLLQLSGSLSLTAWLADLWGFSWTSLLAPSLLLLVAVFLIVNNNVTRLFIGALVIFFIGAILLRFEAHPQVIMACLALVTGFYAGVFMNPHNLEDAWVRSSVLLVMLIALTMGHWLQDWPRTAKSIQILLPDAKDAFEADYFSGYLEAIRFGGLDADVISTPGDILPGSLILLPWLTEQPLARATWGEFIDAAKDNKATVLVFAEHTNLGGVAERINGITSGVEVRNDLTVPPGNVDWVGNTRASSLISFHPLSLLNRGASLRLTSPWAKAMIIGDGWHSDPPSDDVTWVGDYHPDMADLQGRLTLVASIADGARWVFVGDNSFVLNLHLVADPRPLHSLILLASLWPTFLSDLCVILVCLGAFAFSMPQFAKKANIFVATTVVGIVLIAVVVSPVGGYRWNEFYVNQGGFDPRNFNKAVLELLNEHWFNELIIVRHKNYLEIEKIGRYPEFKEVHFGMVKDELAVGQVHISDCWRVGSLSLPETGVTLQNAQACRVSGDAKILIGTKDAASAIEIQKKGNSIVIILDDAFLSNIAGKDANISWFKHQFRGSNGVAAGN